jgi:hypothetical protein
MFAPRVVATDDRASLADVGRCRSGGNLHEECTLAVDAPISI